MATFADRRTYLYGGKVVDQQDHLGFDLASVGSAPPCPPPTTAWWCSADYFGIYGNTVVVDHGYGLMSLYAHLSSIDVQAGPDGRARAARSAGAARPASPAATTSTSRSCSTACR